MIKISVIIPAFNTEKYLSECLDSVIFQTLKEIEVICINDGSEDGSEYILEEYSRNDSRITVISQENTGTGAARNKGLQIAKGQFVAFMDSDDYYPENNILEILYTTTIKNDTVIGGGSWSELKIDGSINSIFNGNKLGYTFYDSKKMQYQEYQFDYGFQRFIYNREFLMKHNIIFCNTANFEDPPFFINALIQAGEFYAVPKVVYRYRCGYKKWKFNEKQALDTLYGLRLNFEIARKNNLFALYNLTLDRLGEFLLPFSQIRSLKVMTSMLNLYTFLDTHFVTLFHYTKYSDWLYNIFYDEKANYKKNYEQVKEINDQFLKLIHIGPILSERTSLFLLIKSYFLFPWYIYKIYRIVYNNPIKKRDMFRFLCSYIFFPYFVFKTYQALLGILKTE